MIEIKKHLIFAKYLATMILIVNALPRSYFDDQKNCDDLVKLMIEKMDQEIKGVKK